MIVYMVYAWHQYYPETADTQVIGLFHELSAAIAMMDKISTNGRYQFIDYVEMEIQ